MAISRQARPIYVSRLLSGRGLNFVNEIDYFVTAEAAVRPAAEAELR